MLSGLNCDLNNVEILHGSTSAHVMLIDNKLVYRKDKPENIQRLVNFYQLYAKNDYFPKLAKYEPDYSSMLLEYVPGDLTLENVNQTTYDNIKEIVDSYISVTDSGVSWRLFIKKRKDLCLEIYELYGLDIYFDYVKRAYYQIKENTDEMYLAHGDLGAHSFVSEGERIIKVIDAEPLIANKLYDYYFCIASSRLLLQNYDISEIDSELKEAYFVFNLFASISKVLFHHPEDKEFYLDYIMNYKPRFISMEEYEN